MSRGPKAAPGKYYVFIKVGKDSLEKEFDIKTNPAYKCTVEDYKLKTS